MLQRMRGRTSSSSSSSVPSHTFSLISSFSSSSSSSSSCFSRSLSLPVLLISIILIRSSYHGVEGADQPHQRDALLDFYNQMSGVHWTTDCLTNWRSQASYCTWYGVTCDDKNTDVLSLDLTDCNLSGTIPESMKDLHALQLLSLRLNHISGAFSARNLPKHNLVHLDLSENELSGDIPASIGDLVELTYLDLGANQLEGEIPDSLGNLVKLQTLDISFNKLSGSFPGAAIELLTNLGELDISMNKLSGSIPGSFPLHQQLVLLQLSSNNFSGDLHSNFFSNCAELTSLSLSDNKFSGSFPINGMFCPKLTVLDITNNQFTGFLNLTDNFFAKNLITFRVSRNKFSDSMNNWSRGLLQMEKLVLVDFAYNEFSGEVPDVMGRLPKLDYLFLNNNTAMHSNSPYCHDEVDKCLPSFLDLTWTQLAQPVGRFFYCATVVGKYRSINVRIDNEYFSFANCRCFADYYWSHDEQRCLKCLPFGYCPGGEYQHSMVAEPGYWGSPNPENPIAFLKCPEFAPNSSACNPERSLNTSEACAEGHTDRLCSRCEDGWYPWGGQCFKCSYSSLSVLLPFLGVVGLALFFLYLIKMRTAPLGSVTTLFFFLQVVNILAEMGLPLPPALTSLYEGSSTVNLRFPGGPECYMGTFNFIGRFLMVLLIPIFFAVSFAFIYSVGIIWIRIRPPAVSTTFAKRRWLILNVRAFLFMLDFCYLVICATIFRTFLCHKDPVTGLQYMTAAPYIQCDENDGEYWTMYVFAITFCVVYVVGIPVLFATLLYHFHNVVSRELQNENENEVTLFIGWLHCDFKPEFYFWELVMLCRKAIFAMAISLTSFASYVLPVFIFIILVASLLLHRFFRPFITPVDNTSEEISALVLLFNFYMALIYFVPTFTVKYLYQLGYLTVFVNLLFLTYIMLVMIKNIGFLDLIVWCYRWAAARLRKFDNERERMDDYSSTSSFAAEGGSYYSEGRRGGSRIFSSPTPTPGSPSYQMDTLSSGSSSFTAPPYSPPTLTRTSSEEEKKEKEREKDVSV